MNMAEEYVIVKNSERVCTLNYAGLTFVPFTDTPDRSYWPLVVFCVPFIGLGLYHLWRHLCHS